MSKKDYILIAKCFSDYLDNGDNDMVDGIIGGERLARSICERLQAENPKFNREKFLKACGIESECQHDWDNYGKCCSCGKWNIE